MLMVFTTWFLMIEMGANDMEVKPFNWKESIMDFTRWVKRNAGIKEDAYEYSIREEYEKLKAQGLIYKYSEYTSDLMCAVASSPEMQQELSNVLVRQGVPIIPNPTDREKQAVFNAYRGMLNEAIVNTLIKEAGGTRGAYDDMRKFEGV